MRSASAAVSGHAVPTVNWTSDCYCQILAEWLVSRSSRDGLGLIVMREAFLWQSER